MCALCGACGEDPVESEVTKDTDPPVDLLEIEGALEAFAVWVPVFRGDPVAKVARDFRTLGTQNCPELVSREDEIGWIGGCAANDVWFVGGGLVRETNFSSEAEASAPFRDRWGPQLATEWTDDVPELYGMTLLSNAFVELEDGAERALAGSFAFVDGEVDGVLFRRRLVGGTVLDSDAVGGEHDWVAAGVQANIVVDEAQGPNGFAREIEGLFSGLDATWDTVEAVGARAGPTGCQLEPAGDWFLRHPSGVWAEVSFDPDTNCDGCGELRYDGAVVAVVCPDMAALWQPMEEP